MEENQPITARWNTQDVSVQARAELEKAHPVGEVSAVVCWWGLCHATKWQILTDANFPLLDADGNKVGTWDRIMWGKQEKMRWRSLIGFVFWCFVSSFTLGINSEKVHFRCMASQPPSLEMLVLTTSVAGCPKSFVLHVRNWYWKKFDEKNPYKSNAPGTYFQLRPYLLSCKSLDVIKGRALALNSRQGSLTVKDERDGKCLKFETTVIQFSRFHWFQIDSNWFHLWKFDPICLKFANLMDFFFPGKTFLERNLWWQRGLWTAGYRGDWCFLFPLSWMKSEFCGENEYKVGDVVIETGIYLQ